MKTILIIGKEGQVGWELQRALAPLGNLVALDRQSLDLTNPAQIQDVICHIQPDIIVNAAAYTAVDKAETESELALQINGLAPSLLAQEAQKTGALLIHYSTDYVFDGSGKIPYAENAPTAPLNAYGRTKLAGEEAILASGCRHLIFRTSWVYASRGKNFLLTMLRLGKERPQLRIVNDQIGAPTWARMIAQGTGYAIDATLQSGHDHPNGIYHLTAAGQTNWHDFASSIFRLQGQSSPELIPITTAEYPLPAARPKYSVLSNNKLHQDFGFLLPSWEESLALCLNEIHS